MSVQLDSAHISAKELEKPFSTKKAGLTCHCSIGLIPLASVIIGAVAAAGYLTPLAFSATTIALGGLGFLGSLTLMMTATDNQRWIHLFDTLIYGAITALGALFMTGVLPLSTVCYSVIGLGGAGLLTSASFLFIRA